MPGASSSTARPHPTTAGISSERARIAVWEFGPPSAVQMPLTRSGFSAAVSDGLRSSATRMISWSGRDLLFAGADQQAHDASADIAKIVGPCRQQGIVEGGQFGRPLLQGFAPCEGRAFLVVVDPEAGGFDQVGVFQELPVGQEDAGFRLAGALVDGAVKFFQFGARPVDRMVQVGALRLRIDGMPLDDGLRVFAKLINRAMAMPGAAAMPWISPGAPPVLPGPAGGEPGSGAARAAV